MTRKELFGEMVGNVTNFTGTAGNGQVTLTWTDPEDTVYEDVILPWMGTRVLRKEGSSPADENDGIVVVDSRVRNQYNTTSFVDIGLANGITYYYKAFPYTMIYNLNDENEISITPTDPFTLYNGIVDLYSIHSSGILTYIVEDNDFLYIAGETSIQKIDKLTNSVVAYFDTATAFRIDDMIISGDYIFICDYRKFYKINKYNLSIVSTIDNKSNKVRCMAVEDNYLYVCGDSLPIKKYNISDLSLVATSAVIDHEILSITVYDDHIYVGVNNATYTTIRKFSASDLSFVSQSPYSATNIFSLKIHDGYIYTCGNNKQTISKYNLSDLSYICESASCGGTIHYLDIKDNYIYASSHGIYKYDLSNLSIVKTSPRNEQEFQGLLVNDDYIYTINNYGSSDYYEINVFSEKVYTLNE